MAIRITFAMRGAAELLQYLQRARQQFPGATAAAVYIEGLTVLRQARPNVPVDTSLLVNSEWCSLPSTTVPNPIAHLGYAAPYALAVHERTEVRHFTGKAGWLRDAMNAQMTDYPRRLLARIIAYAKKGINAPAPDSRIPTSPEMETMLKKVKSYLRRDKGRTKDQRTIAYGKVERLLDRHEQGHRATVH